MQNSVNCLVALQKKYCQVFIFQQPSCSGTSFHGPTISFFHVKFIHETIKDESRKRAHLSFKRNLTRWDTVRYLYFFILNTCTDFLYLSSRIYKIPIMSLYNSKVFLKKKWYYCENVNFVMKTYRST